MHFAHLVRFQHHHQNHYRDIFLTDVVLVTVIRQLIHVGFLSCVSSMSSAASLGTKVLLIAVKTAEAMHLACGANYFLSLMKCSQER